MEKEKKLALLKNIPEELKKRKQWLLWRLEGEKGKKPRKPPYTCKGEKASSTNPTGWDTFENVVAEYAATTKYDGIGFVFTEKDPYTGVDLDDCIGKNGVFLHRQSAWIETLSSYTEKTQGGHGFHIFLKNSNIPGNKRRCKAFEVYSENQYFAMTGNVIPGLPLEIKSNQPGLTLVYNSAFPQTQTPIAPTSPATPNGFADNEIVKKISKAKNKKEFTSLFQEGDISKYPSHSEADLALCGMLAFYTKEQYQLDRIFRNSALFQNKGRAEKWNSKRNGNSTYGEATVKKAISCSTGQYTKKYNPAKKNMPKVSKTGFFEYNKRTFYTTKNKKGETEEVEYGNFSLAILDKVYDDSKAASWNIEVEGPNAKAKIEIEGPDLFICRKFTERIAQAGEFLANTNSIQIHKRFIEFVLEKAKYCEKRKTQYIGRAKGSNFVFNNAIASPGKIAKIKNLVVVPGKLNIHIPNRKTLKEYWKTQIHILHDIYGEELWKIIGFSIGSIFVDEIVEEYASFPLLFLNGEKGCGKSTLFNIILALFGAHREIKPHNITSTKKASFRKSERYRGIPLVLNEYHPTKTSNSVVQAFFDREGYSRAKTSNDLETHDTEINSTFILVSTRNITGYEAEAVNSRLVTVDFGKYAKSTAKDRKIFLAAIKAEKKYFSSFVPTALLINPKTLLSQAKESCFQLETTVNAESRLIETHSIIKAAANCFYKILDIEDQYGISGLSGDIQKQSNKIKQSGSVRLFLSILDSQIQRRDLPTTLAKRENNMLIFHMSAYEHVKRFCASSYDKEALPDKGTMIKLLSSEGAKRKSSRILEGLTAKSTWFVKYTDGDNDVPENPGFIES